MQYLIFITCNIIAILLASAIIGIFTFIFLREKDKRKKILEKEIKAKEKQIDKLNKK